MKINQLLFACFLITLLNSIIISQQRKVELHKNIKRFSRYVANYFHRFASMPFCSKIQLKRNQCCNKYINKTPKRNKKWNLFKSYNKDGELKWSILYSTYYYKVVLSFGYYMPARSIVNQLHYCKSSTLGGRRSRRAVCTLFYKLYKASGDKVRKAMKKIFQKFPKYQYIILGGQIGGALATIFVDDLVRKLNH